MNLLKTFSVLGLVVMASACGSSQPTTQSYGNAYNPYGTGYNNGYGTQTGYGSTPIYSGNQIIGYRSTVALMGGQQMTYGTTLQASATVMAGDRITVNLGNATYSVGQATCSGVLNTNLSGFGGVHSLTNATLTLNGQAITGSTQVTTSGTLSLTAYLSPISINCSILYGNQTATVNSYMVNLGYAVTKDSCTNLQGGAMACPY